ncbi:MAG: hypothetical protein WBC13_00785 [Dokdonella sp.]
MGKISNYLANELLDHVFNAAYTPAATVYLALSTANPTDDGSGMAEPSGNGYARQAITFGAAASRRVTQSGVVTFPIATGAWGTVTHWAVFDASTAGNMLAHGDWSVAKSIVANNTPSAASGEVWIEVSAGGEMSTTLAHNLLNLAFRNVAYAKPATYVGMATATLTETTTGSTVTEPSGNGYARTQVNINGGAAPAWALAASRQVVNGGAVSLPAATGAWGTVVASFIASAVSGGDILFFDNGTTDQAVASGDTMQFAASAITVGLN